MDHYLAHEGLSYFSVNYFKTAQYQTNYIFILFTHQEVLLKYH